ncbi:MAG TPA: HNH endonuclease [Povalibacter sp.]|nr:HNH endonuclease [Povalibacter sp.]
MSDEPVSPLSSRRSTGKRLRFEVFKRDYFTCRYCGAQPPDVVLVVDHIMPVAAGGPSTIDNLISACEACNQGKGAHSLNEVPPRSDADLLYMEVQQEIAELRRYQRAVQERDTARQEFMEWLRSQWCESSGLDWGPSDTVLRPLLLRYTPDVVADAVLDVADKISTGYLGSYGERWVRYLNGAVKHLAERRYGQPDDVVSEDR